ncbi:MAG: type II toxin-antitoxin system antitoxin SocA domain-containing protein [Clostridium sp.]
MSKEKRAYCENCNDLVSYCIKENQIMYDDIQDVEFLGKRAYCLDCNEEIEADDIESYNFNIALDMFRKKEGLISIGEINTLLDKYQIGSTVLSDILGWGNITISRYQKGQTPSYKYSKVLLDLLDDPQKMYRLVLENKNKITDLAFKKSINAINRFIKPDLENGVDVLDENLGSCTKLDAVIYYLCDGLEITNKALQKLLYYAQGFSLALLNEEMFSNDAEAWVHGPVYREVYSRFCCHQYNPIAIENIKLGVVENTLSVRERILLDNLRTYFACYTGNKLEDMTHNELPWLNARGGLKPHENSDRIISKEDIKTYFVNVKNKLNILNCADIKVYPIYIQN